MTLRGRGLNYDTGFFPGGKNSRPLYDPAGVRRDMAVIARDLHCSAVRVSGGDPVRLTDAATAAKDEGLEVWFAPFPCELGEQELRPLLSECAERAAMAAADVLVLGCEMSPFSRGFLPGDTVYDGFYPEMIGSLVKMSASLGKPFTVTEFGCCTYEGAADQGGMGWAIVDETADPPRIKGTYRRSEAEQVGYLGELLATFDERGVDSAFWFTFATFGAVHSDDPARDFDLGAYGLVKMLDEEHWEPKEGFYALAAEYAKRS
jgi:hypothetical protein